jgi:hypothetical protein
MGDISGANIMALKCTSIELSEGWTFKQADNPDPNAWLPVKEVPSTVHQDLIDNKRYKITHACISVCGGMRPKG